MPAPTFDIGALRAIAWTEWDPLGARGFGGPADEYDAYLVQAAAMLRRGAPDEAVAAYLCDVAQKRLQAAADMGAAERTAAAIRRHLLLAGATADEIIARLDLEPHPEGGHYRETFRDPRATSGGRAASTAIYFLLAEGEASRWHRVDAAEVWHWHAGAPLALEIAAAGPPGSGFEAAGPRRRIALGPSVLAGEEPQAIVPAGDWQQARSLGRWTLVGCTVAPGFTFDGFELAT